MRARVLTSLILCAACLPARADDWPQFRGPGGTGVSSETKLPSAWDKSKNVQWKVTLPGVAWSSPVVWGDKVFVTTAITEKQTKPKPFRFGGGGGGFGRPGGGFGPGGFGGGKPPDTVYRWEVLCLDRANGKVLWKELAAEKKPAIPATMGNSYASETPITDGERVYAYFGTSGGVYCFNLEGKKLWSKDLGSYPMMMGWGSGSSPALDGERLFVQCDNEKKSSLSPWTRRPARSCGASSVPSAPPGQRPSSGRTRSGPKLSPAAVVAPSPTTRRRARYSGSWAAWAGWPVPRR